MRKMSILVCFTLLFIVPSGGALSNPARLGDDFKLTIPAGDFNGACLRLVFDLFENPKDAGNINWKLALDESGVSQDCGSQSTEIRSDDVSIGIPFLEFNGGFYSVELNHAPAIQDDSGLVWKLTSGAVVGAPFNVTTNAFDYGKFIPETFSWYGPNVSPALAWGQAPDGTKSLVLIMDDPDAPGGVWTHWVVYDIPAGVSQLAEGAGGAAGLPSGARHGVNTSGNNAYDGPGPPPGPAHRYFFKLFALSVSNLNPGGASVEDIRAAMEGNILAVTEIMGLYAAD